MKKALEFIYIYSSSPDCYLSGARVVSVSIAEQAVKMVNQWISVKDKLPNEDEEVLCTDGEEVFQGRYIDLMGGWQRYDEIDSWPDGSFNHVYTDCVTGWMPLPEKPK